MRTPIHSAYGLTVSKCGSSSLSAKPYAFPRQIIHSRACSTDADTVRDCSASPGAEAGARIFARRSSCVMTRVASFRVRTPMCVLLVTSAIALVKDEDSLMVLMGSFPLRRFALITDQHFILCRASNTHYVSRCPSVSHTA
ncbi:hypothetical protein HYDPIDRAFT_117442 [Hydnomerulius pinastri MD-312]|uniref:Uncharacterized protein n=1 Tax=Hydnomerulius pinastri MD-312 TaxID=994086 RepID=A0A0C9VR29_9AGAM|nr:hypothetical protein HYDPIDRAFT_117442 [Hydnomerulius pinastri MD-312]